MEPVIGARDLEKQFAVRGFSGHVVPALRGVSLDVAPGEFVGLVGESGCGKSTLSRILIGVESATSGEVLHEGRPVETREEWASLRRDVQYVFQDPYGSLPPRMRIGDVLTDPLRIHGMRDRHERAARAIAMLQEVGMPASAMQRYPSAFSGGQRQRISIARALVLEPRVIICDEIVSGLDVSVQAQVLNLLLDLQASRGLGVLFISHDLRVIRYLCSRVCVMYLGEIVEEGAADELFADPQHPYTQGLLASSPDRAAPGQLAARVAGEPPSSSAALPACPFEPRCPRRGDVCAVEVPPEIRLGGHRALCHFPGAPATAQDARSPITDRA